MSRIEIIRADLERADHQRAVVVLVDAYAQDPMGNGRPLAVDVRESLIDGLRKHPTTLIWLAWLAVMGQSSVATTSHPVDGDTDHPLDHRWSLAD